MSRKSQTQNSPFPSKPDAIRRIEPGEAVKNWAFYEPLIRSVVERADSGVYPEGVLTCIQCGDMQLWRALKGTGIAVTEIQNFPRYRLLLVFMVAGENAQEWLADGDHQLVAFAKSSGCKYMDFVGRPGWERLCRQFGYDRKQIRMRKDV